MLVLLTFCKLDTVLHVQHSFFPSHSPAPGESLAPVIIIVLDHTVTQPHFPLGGKKRRLLVKAINVKPIT